MPSLDSISTADLAVLASPAAQALRARIAPLLGAAVLPQLAQAKSSLPSYVVAAIDTLFTALQQWETDEQVIKNARRS